MVRAADALLKYAGVSSTPMARTQESKETQIYLFSFNSSTAITKERRHMKTHHTGLDTNSILPRPQSIRRYRDSKQMRSMSHVSCH